MAKFNDGNFARLASDVDGSGQLYIVLTTKGHVCSCRGTDDKSVVVEFPESCLVKILGWFEQQINTPSGDTITIFEHRDIPGQEYAKIKTTWDKYRVWQSLDNNLPAKLDPDPNAIPTNPPVVDPMKEMNDITVPNPNAG